MLDSPVKDDSSFKQDVIHGLTQDQKVLPCRWLYDERGSELFEEITQLEEYYPTRTETKILRAYAADMADKLGPQATIVEYGAGASVKTRILLDALEDPSAYIPVDISEEFLQDSAAALQKDYPDLEIQPVVADFLSPIDLPDDTSAGIRGGFFPGSTIGNLSDAEILGFMTRARQDLGPDAQLILGVDIKKDPKILIPAYDDAKGVTAEFNLNILKRINRELGADINVDAFSHEARWNEEQSRIEMHLVSERDQTADICGQEIVFRKKESIHTENSRKFQISVLEDMVAECGWELAAEWFDENKLFSMLLFRAV